MDNANLPEEISKVLLEKIISRRNSILRAVKLGSTEIKFDPNISLGKNLVNGKLLKENWKGYASRFAYGDPETPLNRSELSNFFKSKLISNALSNSINFFNTNYLLPDLNRDSVIGEQYNKARLDYLFRVFDGKSRKTDLYFFSYPVAGGQLISSRNVTIGGIDGGESKIMLSDSFGFRLFGGYRAGTFDFPIVTDLNAGAEVGISRVYTHLTPLLSLKKALKTPFKNLIVNWAQKNTYKECNPLLEMSSEVDEELVEKCYKLLDEGFEVGESLIITDSIDLGGSLEYTQNLDALLEASAKISGSGVTLRKTHLHRVSKDTFQLYIDKGLKGSVSLSFSLNYGVQVLSVGNKNTLGKLKTDYYPWNLKKSPSVEEKKDFLAGIIRFLFSSKSDLIRAQINPYRLGHRFGVRQTDLNLLVWQRAWRTNNIRSSITHKDDKKGKYTKEFVSYSKGKRFGRNYVQLLAESIGRIFVDALDDESISFDFGDDRDPANTPFGHSVTREVVFESEVTKEENVEKLEKPMININYRWRGWKLGKSKAQNIVSEINEKFDFPFFHKDIFHQTKNIQIYNVGIKVTLYDDFIDQMMNINEKTLKKYFEKRIQGTGGSHKPGGRGFQKKRRVSQAIERIKRLRRKWKSYLKSNNVSKAYKSVTKMVSTLEALIPFRELVQIVDSKKYFAIGSIHGFREGDENGDSSQFSHALGSVGGRYSQGKIHFLRNQIGMIPNEFYGHWFIGKL